MQMITGRDAKMTEAIEEQVWVLVKSQGSLPERATEYGGELCRGFKIASTSSARGWVDRWLAVGWAVGTVEEANDAARPGKSEGHHLAALNFLRATMFNMAEGSDDEEVLAYLDAYYLALFGGYYLRRDPNATAQSLDAGRRGE
jgi:hypothetical protein